MNHFPESARRLNRFEGKTSLVTGGTQGMGLAVAEALAREGANVIICGRHEATGSKAADRIAQAGNTARFIACDVADPDAVSGMIGWIVQTYGSIDCAFNNAGVTAPHARLGDSSVRSWQDVININLNGTYYCLRAELAAMARGGGGAIVNNSSVAGLMAIPGQGAYVASKFAIAGLTQAAAIEYAQAAEGTAMVRVNGVAPGPILGGMNDSAALDQQPERTKRKLGATAMRRFGQAEEVAAAVLWLLSDEASYVTGTILPVDGGAVAGKF